MRATYSVKLGTNCDRYVLYCLTVHHLFHPLYKYFSYNPHFNIVHSLTENIDYVVKLSNKSFTQVVIVLI